MGGLIAGSILIAVLDQAIKLFALRWLGQGSVPLGRIGKLQVVPGQMWIARGPRRSNFASFWTLWVLAAGALTVVTAQVPSCGWFAGMLLGGSLSHAMETSWRGWICDYVCLRFWPAFNVSDVALTVGAVGVGVAVWT
jgi:signal peptidase II